MSDIAKIMIGVLMYVVCFSLSIVLLAETASAGAYVSNNDRDPHVKKEPPQVAKWE